MSTIRRPSFGDAFRLTLLTDDVELAARADRAGIDCIGVDIEQLGKAERQEGHDTRLSSHDLGALAALSAVVTRAKLFARLNPLHEGTQAEIEEALEQGAQVLMLPYFRGAAEVERFASLVAGRARTSILVETAASIVRLRDILAVEGVDEVMVGLNDLRLEMRVEHHFEILVSPLMETIADAVHRAGLPLGIGGVARPDAAGLPVNPDWVLAQYPRLGATGAWVSRSFFAGLPDGGDVLVHAVRDVRTRLDEWSCATPATLESAREALTQAIKGWKADRHV